jgi:uncharacterized protein (DUF1697 family)
MGRSDEQQIVQTGGYTGLAMAVIVSMLRGVNLASHNRVKMEALRALYESLGFRDPQTYVQSGNVVSRLSSGAWSH